MSDPTHSFILPAYNESERLTTSIPKVLEYVHDRGLQAEIIVVNDGSTDDHGRGSARICCRQSHDCVAGEPRQSRQGVQRAQRDVARQGRGGFVYRRRSFLTHYRSRQAICGAERGCRCCDRIALAQARAANRAAADPSATVWPLVQPGTAASCWGSTTATRNAGSRHLSARRSQIDLHPPAD